MATNNTEPNQRKVLADALLGLPCCARGCQARAVFGVYCSGSLEDLRLAKEVVIIAPSGHYHIVCDDHTEYSGNRIPLSELSHLPVEWWNEE